MPCSKSQTVPMVFWKAIAAASHACSGRATHGVHHRGRGHRAGRANLHLAARDLGGERAANGENHPHRARREQGLRDLFASERALLGQRDQRAGNHARRTAGRRGANHAHRAVHMHHRQRPRRRPRVQAADGEPALGFRFEDRTRRRPAAVADR